MVALKTEIATMIHVSDGTQWSFPTPDPDGSASWRLRYTEWQPSREERLLIASILDSYTDLVYAPNQKKVSLVIKGIKEGMKST